MNKRVWLAGCVGGVVMFVWLFISNAILPVKSNMIHRVVPNQLEVHEALNPEAHQRRRGISHQGGRGEDARLSEPADLLDHLFRNDPR